MKHILIVNHNAGAPCYGPNYRSYYVARSLVERGYRVTIIASSYSHKLHKLPRVTAGITKEMIDGIQYLWIRTRPFRGNLGRLFNYWQFYRALTRLPELIIDPVDTVICSSPPPFWIWAARKAAYTWDAQLIFEVRDLWPQVILDTSRTAGNISAPLIALMDRAQKTGYRDADFVVGVSPGFESYMTGKGLSSKRFVCIHNGINLDQTRMDLEPLPKAITMNLPREELLVGYVGGFGGAYGLQHLIEAARQLQGRGVGFVLAGGGGECDRLCRMAADLEHVLFIGQIPKSQVASLLDRVHVCFASFVDRPAIRFGVSQNKLFDYMAARKPILFALNSPFNPVADASCGLVVKPESATAIVDGISQFQSMGCDQLDRMGDRGRAYLESHFTYDVLVEQWIAVIGQRK